MLRYLLDTNIVIDVIRRRPPEVREVFNPRHGRMAISAITLAGLAHGAERSSDPPRNLAVIEEFCSRLEVLPYTAKAAMHFGSIRVALKARGTPIGPMVNPGPPHRRPCAQRRPDAGDQQSARIRAGAGAVERKLAVRARAASRCP
ncbi:type II toxin-antitoxin system VapC family toxin [Methyloversatilis thermotolerans]|uniref:type II toxin-antitoxin system VapC family toxin n=1 Tax=Methyloversatilis thermotolerans TaxID=1346290 RepID=UPI0003A64F03|nr:type II toxin-antitoxin system VapC family toxin [Methyloversatilis thermotolerans]